MGLKLKPTPSENPFRHFWDKGYTNLIPIMPPGCPLSENSSVDPADRGKAPGMRTYDGTWASFGWRHHKTTTQELIVWNGMGASVGLRLGQGVVAIDLDTLSPEWAERLRNEIERRFGRAPVRIGNRPKSLYLIRVPEGVYIKNISIKFDNGLVEIHAEGRQVVVWGVHATTGRLYEWEGGIPAIDELPTVLPVALDKFVEDMLDPVNGLPGATLTRGGNKVERSNKDQEQLVARDFLTLESAVHDIQNPDVHYDDYVRMGYAIKAATQTDEDLGFKLWSEWAAKSHKYNPDRCEKDWKSFKGPFGVGAAYLYDRAGRESGGGFDSNSALAAQVFDKVQPEDQPDTLNLFDKQPEAEAKPGKLKFEHFSDIAAGALLHTNAPLIEGLLDEHAMSVLYGDSNVGKTFVALDISYHIAAGKDWGGMKVTQRPVVYVVAEGGGGARKRILALARKYKMTEVPFYIVFHPIDLLHAKTEDADLYELVRGIKQVCPDVGFIVIDTLSRALAGGNENSSEDMGALVRHFDLIRKHTGAHLMVIHHTGKDQARGARGHSLLRAATDTEIEVTTGQIQATKQRDLDKNVTLGFDFEGANLGSNDRGQTVTSATIKVQTGTKETLTQKRPLDGVQAHVWDAIEVVTEAQEYPEQGFKIDDLMTFFKDAGDTINREHVKKRVLELYAKNYLTKLDRGRYKIKLSGSEVFENVNPNPPDKPHKSSMFD